MKSNSIEKFKPDFLKIKEWRRTRFLEYFTIPKEVVLPVSHGHEILSCGVNPDNPKNKIKYIHSELETQIRLALIYFNQEFKLIDFGEEIIMRDPKKHFSCKFFFPVNSREDTLISDTTNMYELFKKHSYCIPFQSILNIAQFPPVTHDRFNTYLVIYNLHAYLLVEDNWYPVFMYADLVLAQKHTKHDHRLECESAAHSLASIVMRQNLKKIL